MTRKNSIDFDIIIPGSGPAGMFAAYEAITLNPGLKILLLDKGPIRAIDDVKNNLFGWGGAGAFSDGKLTLSSEVGGQLDKLLPPEELDELMRYIKDLYQEFGGKQKLEMGSKKKIAELTRRAEAAGLELIPYAVMHWGREGAYRLVEKIRKHLKKKKVKILLNSEVVSIERDGEKSVVILKNGKRFYSDFLVLAPGRAGADWLAGEMEKLGVATEDNPVDLGIRYEAKKSLLEELTSNLRDFKLRYWTHERRDFVRTFCACPAGSVIVEEHTEGDPPYNTVNGQSNKIRKTKNTNFAILVSMPLDIKDPNAYGKHAARAATLLADGSVLVQTLADFQNRRRSKPDSLTGFSVKPTLTTAMPGDLRLALPERFVAAISEMLTALDKFIPGINEGNNALLYGIETKFYSRKITIGKNCETVVPGIYVAGDGSGWTRGIIWSAAMGIVAARDIVNKKKS